MPGPLPRLTLAAVLCALAAGALGSTRAAFVTTATETTTVSSYASFAPVNVAAPSVSGATLSLLALAGTPQTLTVTPGAWRDPKGQVPANLSITTAEQWVRCRSGTCTDIPGATGTTLSVGTTVGGLGLLAGDTIGVVETATFGATSATAASNLLTVLA